MTALDEVANALQRRAVAIIDGEQYFDASPEKPKVVGDINNYSVTLLIHLGVHGADRLLTRGPNWTTIPKHPYIKIEQVWRNAGLVYYIYQMSDPSFSYTEGYHLHRETNTHGHGVYHHTRKVGRQKEEWTELRTEMPLADALKSFVDAMWALRDPSRQR
jgi:hypothetical protein